MEASTDTTKGAVCTPKVGTREQHKRDYKRSVLQIVTDQRTRKINTDLDIVKATNVQKHHLELLQMRRTVIEITNS